MKVPFAYDLDIRQTTGNRVKRSYREYLDLDVPSVDLVSFPVAFSRPGIGDRGWAEPEQLRVHDGRFFKLLETTGMAGPRRLAIRDLETVVEGFGLRDYEIGLSCPAIVKASTVKLKGPPKASSIEYGLERRQDAIASVKRAVGRYLLCDGALYAAVPEPVLQLSRNSASFVLVTDGVKPESHPLSFRVTEVERARSFASAYFDETPSRVSLPDFKVDIPEACQATFEFSLSVTLREIQQKVMGDLPRHPLAVMGAFCDLRDVTRFLGGNEKPDHAEQLRLGRALCDALEGHGLQEALVRETRLCLDRAETDMGLDLTEDDLTALAM